MSEYLSIEEWKRKGAEKGAKLAVVGHAKGIDEENRTALFKVSEEAEDRDGDIVFANGWDLTNYLANPVVLWGHDRRELPIGHAESISIEGKALFSRAKFATREESPFADSVFRMIVGRHLRASSAGFNPKEFDFDEERGGYNLRKNELLEWSVVTIPANSLALVQAKSEGINVDPLAEFYGKQLEGEISPSIFGSEDVMKAAVSALSTATVVDLGQGETMSKDKSPSEPVSGAITPEVDKSVPEVPEVEFDGLISFTRLVEPTAKGHTHWGISKETGDPVFVRIDFDSSPDSEDDPEGSKSAEDDSFTLENLNELCEFTREVTIAAMKEELTAHTGAIL